MNIFVLSYSAIPQVHYKENARMHCDKHVVKMITESVQMLVTVLPQYFSKTALGLEPPCKPLAAGHAKHPCVLWLQQDIIHFNYLAQLAYHLCLEKQARWPLNADHEYQPFIEHLCQCLYITDYLSTHSRLPETFATAVKSESLRSTNRPHVEAVTIYRDYYISDKATFATWRGVGKPSWWPL